MLRFFWARGFGSRRSCTPLEQHRLTGKVISIRSRAEMGFRFKDKQERSVPVSDSLVQALAERKRHSSSMVVFPGANGKPNGHFYA